MDPSGKGKKRRSYTIEFKQQVLRELETQSGESLAKKYGIDPRRIREWKQQQSQLSEITSSDKNRKRMHGGGSKVKWFTNGYCSSMVACIKLKQTHFYIEIFMLKN